MSILLKDIKTYYLKPPNISWGLIFPISWTLMQMIRLPESDLTDLLPGLISMSVLFGTTSMLAVNITFEKSGESFNRLLLAPISLSALIAAKIAGAVIFGLVNAVVPIVFSSFFTNLGGVNFAALVPPVFFIAVTSALLGLLMAITAKQVFEAQTFSNFFRFPMVFLCGLFLPLSEVPKFLLPFSYCLPLTYGTDLLTRTITGGGMISPWLCYLLLLLFSVVLFIICRICVEIKWIS